MNLFAALSSSHGLVFHRNVTSSESSPSVSPRTKQTWWSQQPEVFRQHKWLTAACLACFAVHIGATALQNSYSESFAYLGMALAIAICAFAAGRAAFLLQGGIAIRWGMFATGLALSICIYCISFWTTLPGHFGNPFWGRVGLACTAIRITLYLACLSVAVTSTYRVERVLDVGVALALIALHFTAMHTFGTSFVLVYCSIAYCFLALLAIVGGYCASQEEKPFFQLASIFLAVIALSMICANQIGFGYFHHQHATFWTLPYALGLMIFPILVAGYLDHPATPQPRSHSSNLVVRSLLPFTMGYAVVALSAFILKAHPVIGWCGIAGGITAFAGRTILLHIRLQREMALLAVDNENLTSLASRDFLTGLANRRVFTETFERIAEQGRRGNLSLSVLLIDLDDFKGANDSFGHIHGDNCLMSVADVLRSFTAGRSACISRFGGDEFVILLPGFNARQALSVAQAICRHIRSLRLAGREGSITVSIGISSNGSDLGLTAYLRQADAALYQAKDRGGNSAELFVPLPPGEA